VQNDSGEYTVADLLKQHVTRAKKIRAKYVFFFFLPMLNQSPKEDFAKKLRTVIVL
jgi:hypothetical protein